MTRAGRCICPLPRGPTAAPARVVTSTARPPIRPPNAHPGAKARSTSTSLISRSGLDLSPFTGPRNPRERSPFGAIYREILPDKKLARQQPFTTAATIRAETMLPVRDRPRKSSQFHQIGIEEFARQVLIDEEREVPPPDRLQFRLRSTVDHKLQLAADACVHVRI